MNVKVNEKIKFVPTNVDVPRYDAGTVILFNDGITVAMVTELNRGTWALFDLRCGTIMHEFDNDYQPPSAQDIAREFTGVFMVLDSRKVSINIEVED